MLNPNFVIVGVIIGFLGSFSYFLDTLKGKAKPNRVSFLCWSLAPLIAFFAELKEGVGIQSLMTLMVGLFPLMIFAASFINKKAEWKLTFFDLSCGILSILGLILWLITRTGNIAIAFSLFADLMASTPTIIKSFRFPETENSSAYGTAAIQGLLTVLTIKIWTFANWGYPAYIFLIDLVIFALVQFKIGKYLKKYV